MRFRNRVLSILDRVYNFVGPTNSVQDIELSLPPQLVHDVSREAELGGGSMWGLAANATLAAGTTSHFDWSPYVVGGSGQLQASNGAALVTDDQWAWLMLWGMTVSGSGTLGSVAAYVEPASPDTFLGYETLSLAATKILFFHAAVTYFGHAIDQVYLQRPILIPPKAYIRIEGNETGGTNDLIAAVNAQIWVGPRGVYPPGMP